MLLDGQFGFIRQFEPVPGEKFDAIVVRRVVRSGNNGAGGQFVFHDIGGHAGSRENAEQTHVATCGGDAPSESLFEHRPRGAGVTTDGDDRTVYAEHFDQSTAQFFGKLRGDG